MRKYNKNKIKYKIRTGISYAELLIALVALAVLMLGFSEFTADFFKVSARHGTQIKNVNNARFSAERIITSVNKASYIYPSNSIIQLSGETINTADSLALLTEDNNGGYMFIAYYLAENSDGRTDLYEYISNTGYSWDKDVCPARDMLSFTGSGSVIAEDINTANTDLTYVLNYDNAVYDESLKGELGNALPSDSFALIKGINWNISQETNNGKLITIKGLSRNVPRFFE